MTVEDLARMGGRARADSAGRGELARIGKKGAVSRWEKMSEEERKAHGAMLAAARAKARAGRNK